MSKFFSFSPSVDNIWLWFISILAIVVICVFLVNVVIRVTLAILKRNLSKKYDDKSATAYILEKLYTMIGNPLRWCSWFVGLWVIIDLCVSLFSVSVKIVSIDISWSFKIIELVIVCIFIRTCFKFILVLKEHFQTKNTRTDGGYNDFSSINTLYRAIQVLVIVVAFFIIMGILDISLASLAFLSTAVLGFIAFSQQELIKNIFGGVVLYFDQPFSEGDWITAMDGSFEGTVDKISFRITKFTGFDSRPFYIPNSFFLSKGIINNSRMTNRRILQYIGLRYADFSKVEEIIGSMREYLKGHPRISDKKITLVNVVNGKTNMGSSVEGVFGSYSINIMIYTFTNQTAWVEFQNIQDEVMLGLGKIIENHGAEIAFPTQTIDLPINEFNQLFSTNKQAN